MVSDTLFSPDVLPEFAQWIMEVLPLTHVTACMRAVVPGLDFLWVSFAIILIYGVIIAAIADT